MPLCVICIYQTFELSELKNTAIFTSDKRDRNSARCQVTSSNKKELYFG
jgi:hypothetical protein